MSQPSDWRNASAYEYLSDLTQAELAWEFLRRNESYRTDFRRLTESTSPVELSAFLDRWGLCFRRRP